MLIDESEMLLVVDLKVSHSFRNRMRSVQYNYVLQLVRRVMTTHSCALSPRRTHAIQTMRRRGWWEQMIIRTPTYSAVRTHFVFVPQANLHCSRRLG